MFQGSLVAISTPMKKNGEVDYESYSRLISFHLEHKSDGIVPVGTTGESATLNTKEHNKVIQFVVNEVKGKIPVIAGTGANSTTEAIELTQHAKEAGSDWCLLVTPYYNKPTQEGLFQHYKQIANDVSIPILLYNVPGRTSCDMQPETVQRLSNIGNIIGIKEAVDSVINQSFENWKLYVIDDCSTDKSIEVLRTFLVHVLCLVRVLVEVFYTEF